MSADQAKWERLLRAAVRVDEMWDDLHGIVLLRSRTADGYVDRRAAYSELRAALRDLPERAPRPATGVVMCDCGAPYRVPNAGPCLECGAARRLE